MFTCGVQTVRTRLPAKRLAGVVAVCLAIYGLPQRLLAADADDSARLARFQKVAAPFLTTYCADCHGPEVQEGNLRLDALTADFNDLDHRKHWSRVRARLVAGEMPPADAPQPKPDEVSAIRDWLTTALVRAAETDWQQAGNLPPELGNRISHDLLFGDVTPPLPPATPARLWRIRPEIYFQFLADFNPRLLDAGAFGQKERSNYSQPLSTTSSGGISDYPGTLSIDEQTAAVLAQNARTLADYQMADPRNRRYMDILALVDQESPPSAEAVEKAIRLQFQIAVRRNPTEAELERFTALMQKNISEAGRLSGVRATLAAILLLPEIYVRLELGEGEADEHGRRMLSPRELAFAIAYALTDRRPDDELLAAAEDDRLRSRDEVRHHVERILNDDSIDKPRILRFFREYFNYTDLDRAFKDEATVREYGRSAGARRFHYRPDALVRDTDLLIEHILAQDQDVLAELLTTNRAFVNFRPENPDRPAGRPVDKGEDNIVLYNLQAWPGPKQPFRLPAAERAGILTQPSWLVVHSLNEWNDPIHRGKWIRERLLADPLPDVPLDVDATVPEDPSKTLRERLAITQQAYCWQCHQKMNPVGLSFEMYDPFGAFRTLELDRPVDSSGHIDGTGERKTDGPVEDAVELVHRLARSERVRQVFVRHQFRYFMGRAEMLTDAPTLIAAERAYVESGGSLKALITSLLTSDSFLFRIPVEPVPPIK